MGFATQQTPRLLMMVRAPAISITSLRTPTKFSAMFCSGRFRVDTRMLLTAAGIHLRKRVEVFSIAVFALITLSRLAVAPGSIQTHRGSIHPAGDA